MNSRLPGFCTHLGNQLGLPARPFDANALFDLDTPLDDPTQALTLDALGAALRREEAA